MTTSSPSPPTDNVTPDKERVPLALVLALSVGHVSYISFFVFFHVRDYDLVPAPDSVDIIGLCTLLLSFASALTAIFLCFRAFRRRVAGGLRASTIAPLALTLAISAIVFLGIFPTMSRRPPYRRICMHATAISGDMQNYASKHEGRYPPHLSAFLFEHPELATWFIDNQSVTTPPTIPLPPPPPADWPKYAAEVDSHTIFIYTAADLSGPPPSTPATPALDSAIIIAYTKKLPRVPRHRIVAFTNGEAQLIPDADLPPIFAASNAARAKLGLPPFTLDAPPPNPPQKAAAAATEGSP